MIDTIEENRFFRDAIRGRAVVIESNPPDGRSRAAWPVRAGVAQLGPRYGRFVTAPPPFIPDQS
jgi:hypothetical protein